ncbi:hypothetical protein [Ammoniphilus sp. 3BR4]|uniref:hypothetical protein n=1 Tax=Ammoniphilus sp. 3BR4 TaxID=3158265 RepID=UPI00346500F5
MTETVLLSLFSTKIRFVKGFTPTSAILFNIWKKPILIGEELEVLRNDYSQNSYTYNSNLDDCYTVN